jgi:2-C-methyl-D-erythritol 4-phosphate cytidylyltransferase
MGGDRPKQLLELGGRTILEHSLATLHDHPGVDEVVVVMSPDHLAEAEALVRGLPKVSAVVEGGETRSASTRRALAQLGEEERLVLFHDAARPLLTARIVSDCIVALGSEAAVAVAVPSVDTLLEVDAEGYVRSIPPRATMHRAQTPQGFRLSVIRRAHELAAADPAFEATDDCAVVLRYLPEVPIRVVPGDERNLKITQPTDVPIAERLIQAGES